MDRESKKPNIELRHQRNLRGWSQKRVADAIDTYKEMVSKWERGDQVPSKYYQEKLCQLFEKSAYELGFIREADQSASISRDASNQKLPENNDLQGMLALAVTQGIIGVVKELEGQDLNELRRKILEITLGIAAGKTSLEQIPLLDIQTHYISDETDRLLWMFENSSIDKAALSSLERITESHWQLVYGGVPKRGLLTSVTGHLGSMKHFLQVSQPVAIEQGLSALISQQAQIAVEIYFDMHDYARAEYYSKIAIEAARHATHPTLSAVALARASFLYTYSKQYQEALDLIQLARSFAGKDSDTVVPYWLAAMESEVHSRLYTSHADSAASSASLKSLEEAENIQNLSGAYDPYWTKFSPTSLAAYKGVCFRHLQMPEEAELVLLRALTSIHKDVPGGQATALVDLSSVYVQQGKIEEACNSASQALEIISKHNKSVNTLQRIYDFRQELEPWASTSYVLSLDEQIMVAKLRIAPPSLKR